MRATNGWTGGQLSLVRLPFGAYSAVRFGMGYGDPDSTWLIAGVPVALALAFGVRTRLAALAALGFAVAEAWTLSGVTAAAIVEASPLFVFLFLPPAPFGSYDARGRVDPGGDWRYPDWLLHAVRFAALGAAASLALTGTFAVGIVWLLVLAVDPHWISPRRIRGQRTLFYDGDCALCQGSVRIFVAEDRAGEALDYAPLRGAAFRERLPELDRVNIPDSMVFVSGTGEFEVRSAAALAALDALGGFWRVLGMFARLIPRPGRDWLYDRIAAVRKRAFRAPKGICPLLPPELRARFDLRP